MQEYMIILRIIHIGCGVLWAGGIFMLALFIIPAVKAAGPEGGKMMGRITGTNHFATVMTWAATLNVFAGLLLYWHDASGPGGFMASAQGMATGTGGILAIIAYIIGLSVNRPSILRMTKIGNEVAAAGGKPTDGQMAELGKLRARVFGGTKIMAWLLLITVVLMAVARYLY